MTDAKEATPEQPETAEAASAAEAECDECNGIVKPGTMCPACGINRLNEKSGVFLIATQLPYCPPKLDCCEHAAVEVRLDPDGSSPWDVIVSNAHSWDCKVWQYV